MFIFTGLKYYFMKRYKYSFFSLKACKMFLVIMYNWDGRRAIKLFFGDVFELELNQNKKK